MKFIHLLILGVIFGLVLTGCGGVTDNQQDYTLSIQVQGQGTVTPTNGNKFSSNTAVTLEPKAADGWTFDHWEGKNGSQVVDNKIIINENKSITAVFCKGDYFGLNVGAVRTYIRTKSNSSSVVDTETVLSKEVRENKVIFKVEFKYDGRTDGGSFLGYEGNVYHRYGGFSYIPNYSEDWVNQPKYVIFTAPIKEGSTLGVNSAIATIQEIVTVPAGSFKAWKFVASNGNKIWIAPYVGTIKTEYSDGTTTELTSFVSGI